MYRNCKDHSHVSQLEGSLNVLSRSFAVILPVNIIAAEHMLQQRLCKIPWQDELIDIPLNQHTEELARLRHHHVVHIAGSAGSAGRQLRLSMKAPKATPPVQRFW